MVKTKKHYTGHFLNDEEFNLTTTRNIQFVLVGVITEAGLNEDGAGEVYSRTGTRGIKGEPGQHIIFSQHGSRKLAEQAHAKALWFKERGWASELYFVSVQEVPVLSDDCEEQANEAEFFIYDEFNIDKDVLTQFPSRLEAAFAIHDGHPQADAIRAALKA